jgi:hypothetical protein
MKVEGQFEATQGNIRKQHLCQVPRYESHLQIVFTPAEKILVSSQQRDCPTSAQKRLSGLKAHGEKVTNRRSGKRQ